MQTSLKWIKDLVPGLTVTPQEYMDAMTLSGSKVEGYECQDADLEKIVIGQVEKIERHPDADKLVICQVNIGLRDNSDCHRSAECDRGMQSAGCIRRRTCCRRS